jgi:NAD(P)-dependent dehydrogenase (short-subunit alcohol dehydrogenase family)
MNQLFSIKSKIVLMSGATGVLGSALAEHLASEGAILVVMGRNEEKVKALVHNIERTGGRAFPLISDVIKEEALLKSRNVLLEEFGRIDVLINAAGGNMKGAVIAPDQTVLEADTEALRQVMELNYLGTFLPVKVFLPLFFKAEKGSIINISSMTASRPMTRVMGYSSAKAAIDNLTKWLSVEFCKKHGKDIRVNAIAPGFFLTEQNRSLLTRADGSLTDRGARILDHTPMGTFGEPSDLFGVTQWLCSDASAFVTGTIIPVDGGFSAYSGV